jgi:hypothetical protein
LLGDDQDLESPLQVGLGLQFLDGGRDSLGEHFEPGAGPVAVGQGHAAVPPEQVLGPLPPLLGGQPVGVLDQRTPPPGVFHLEDGDPGQLLLVIERQQVGPQM